MQTLDLQEGEELVLGDVRITVVEVEEDRVLLRIEAGGEVRLEQLQVAAKGG
jgi:sRNA-binding carbon storage regulator CsrA